MKSTVTLDEALLAKARSLAESGLSDEELLTRCVQAFIRQQTVQRLTALGGQVPDMLLPPRRREDPSGA